MGFSLPPEAEAAGYRLSCHHAIDSTSAEALRLAGAGEAGPRWIVSAEQSAGRGRRGSAWESPRGNLFASLLLTTGLPPARIATLGFVAGLALDRALAACCGEGASFEAGLRPAPQDEASIGNPYAPHAEVRARASLEARTPFRLKWPNDVVSDGAKLAGIALGTEEVRPGLRAVVVGIGVNVAHAPSGLPYPAASLASLGLDTDAETLFAALSAAWLRAYATWADGAGFAEIRRLWLARAAGLGGAVAVRTAAGVTRGVFETIDEHGQLVVRIQDGSAHTVSAGEVHFGVAGSATPELRA